VKGKIPAIKLTDIMLTQTLNPAQLYCQCQQTLHTKHDVLKNNMAKVSLENMLLIQQQQ